MTGGFLQPQACSHSLACFRGHIPGAAAEDACLGCQHCGHLGLELRGIQPHSVRGTRWIFPPLDQPVPVPVPGSGTASWIHSHGHKRTCLGSLPLCWPGQGAPRARAFCWIGKWTSWAFTECCGYATCCFRLEDPCPLPFHLDGGLIVTISANKESKMTMVCSAWVYSINTALKICEKKIPESSKKQNFNLLQAVNYSHSISIVLSIISDLEMI